MNDQEFVATFVFFWNIIKVNHCCIVLLYWYIWSLFSFTRSLLVLCAYVSIESIDYILLLSFKLKEILLVPSVKKIWLLLLNLCSVFNIDLLVFMYSLWNFLRLYKSVSFFLDDLFYFQVVLLLNSFYYLQIEIFYRLLLNIYKFLLLIQ